MFQMWQKGTRSPRLQNQRNYRGPRHREITKKASNETSNEGQLLLIKEDSSNSSKNTSSQLSYDCVEKCLLQCQNIKCDNK